jgi:alkanesulfonate monooxygenase SsuD/methylene tetrahydromethanopterin reductase-like flavin-dependent oxidoreductase (luciferase family)
MRLGVMLPIGSGAFGDGQPIRWRDLREYARTAEAVGFDTLLVPDHLLFRRSPPTNALQVAMEPGRTRGIWEAWTLLSALAEATGRIRLGPLVACTAFRNPALLAKMADTLDEISDGRLILGLGAGWHEPEYEAFGYPYDHRVGRFEEALRIIVPLLRKGRVDFEGQYYRARACELLPRGPRPGGPPILIGAQGPRMLGLAAQHADIYDADYQLTPEAVTERMGALDAACAAVGRDPRAVRRWAGTRVAIVASDGRPDPGSAQVGPARGPVADYEVGGMRMTVRRGRLEEIEAHLGALRATGIEHLTLSLVHPPGLRGLERIAPVLQARRA